MPNQKENYCNRNNFEAAIALLKAAAPWNDYQIRETYLDYGAGMKWETIICKTAKTKFDDSYQMLCPRDWDLLQEAGCPLQIAAVVDAIIASQKRLLGL